MKKFYTTIALWLLGMTLLQAVPSAVFAASDITNSMKDAIDSSSINLPSSTEGTNAKSVEQIIGGVIQAFLSIFGILFLALMIYGGYTWLKAQGREEDVQKAKDIIRSAIIGLGVVLLAYAISVYVISRFGAATGFQQ